MHVSGAKLNLALLYPEGMTFLFHRYPSTQAPQKISPEMENGYGAGGCQRQPKECNGGPLLTQSVLQEVRDDLQLHLSLSALLTVPMMLCAPSLIYWFRNLRY